MFREISKKTNQLWDKKKYSKCILFLSIVVYFSGTFLLHALILLSVF